MPLKEPSQEERRAMIDPQYALSRTGWDFEHERREKAVFELKEPLERILTQLRKEIEKGSIQLLIGDDTSGRVPTMVLRQVLAKLYESKGMNPPATVFMNGPGGGRLQNDQEKKVRVDLIKDFLSRCKKIGRFTLPSGSKAFLVTEVIKSGKSLVPVLEACKELSIPCEVISIGRERQKDLQTLEAELGVPIYQGMEGTPSIYRKVSFAGVTKEEADPYDLFALPPEPGLHATPYKNKWGASKGIETQQWLNEIRREMTVLSDELVAWYVHAEPLRSDEPQRIPKE